MVNNIVIADASCLIALGRINRLFILQHLFHTVFITEEIEKEFANPLPKWIVVKQLLSQQRKKELSEIVDEGEASAIALALEIKDCILIIDERKGRKIAKQLNIVILGTLKTLLLSKEKGIITSDTEVVNELENMNFRFSKALRKEILKEAGEM